MDKARFTDGEFRCPKCDSLLLKARRGAEARNLEAWCRKCKTTVLVEIDKAENTGQAS